MRERLGKQSFVPRFSILALYPMKLFVFQALFFYTLLPSLIFAPLFLFISSKGGAKMKQSTQWTEILRSGTTFFSMKETHFIKLNNI